MTILQIHVVKGSGRFIPRPCFSNIVYDAITQRDKANKPQAVPREPYDGPVIQIDKASS